jgi:hypothetical protein
MTKYEQDGSNWVFHDTIASLTLEAQETSVSEKVVLGRLNRQTTSVPLFPLYVPYFSCIFTRMQTGQTEQVQNAGGANEFGGRGTSHVFGGTAALTGAPFPVKWESTS